MRFRPARWLRRCQSRAVFHLARPIPRRAFPCCASTSALRKKTVRFRPARRPSARRCCRAPSSVWQGQFPRHAFLSRVSAAALRKKTVRFRAARRPSARRCQSRAVFRLARPISAPHVPVLRVDRGFAEENRAVSRRETAKRKAMPVARRLAGQIKRERPRVATLPNLCAVRRKHFALKAFPACRNARRPALPSSGAHPQTILTSRPGTKISLRTALPPSSRCTSAFPAK